MSSVYEVHKMVVIWRHLSVRLHISHLKLPEGFQLTFILGVRTKYYWESLILMLNPLLYMKEKFTLLNFTKIADATR